MNVLVVSASCVLSAVSLILMFSLQQAALARSFAGDHGRRLSRLLPVQTAVTIVGVVGVSPHWRALVKDLQTGDTHAAGAGDVAFGVIVERISADATLVSVGTEMQELSLGDVLIRFGPSTFALPSGTRKFFVDPIGLIRITAALRDEDSWFLAVMNYRTGTNEVVETGGVVAGYVIKHASSNAAVLVSSGGGNDALPPQPDSEIPDLIAMTVVDREHWVAGWRAFVASLPSVQQIDARERMRNYWQRQLRGAWGIAMLTHMSAPEQDRVRAMVAAYWQ